MRIFEVIPVIKLQNETEQLNGEKRWKMRWRANPLVCSGLSYAAFMSIAWKKTCFAQRTEKWHDDTQEMLSTRVIINWEVWWDYASGRLTCRPMENGERKKLNKTGMTFSVLMQNPNTGKVRKNAIYKSNTTKQLNQKRINTLHFIFHRFLVSFFFFFFLAW